MGRPRKGPVARTSRQAAHSYRNLDSPRGACHSVSITIPTPDPASCSELDWRTDSHQRQLSRLDQQQAKEKMTCVLEQQTKMEQVVSSKLTTIEGLAQQHSQRLLTLNQHAEASATCTSEAVALNQQILCQLAEDVRHVKYQMSNPTPRGALDPTRELPVILEDALGFQLTIPMDWINGWGVSIPTLTQRVTIHLAQGCT